MASYLLFKKKNLERGKDMIHEKIQKKKKEKCSKKGYYSQQKLESHFWPEKR